MVFLLLASFVNRFDSTCIIPRPCAGRSFTHLWARRCQLLLVQILDCGWSNSLTNFKYFLHARLSSSIGQTNIPQVLPRPLIRRIFPRFIFLSFILILRKAYRRYTSASKEFTRYGLLAFLWISLNEKKKIGNSHNITYIGNPNCIYIT